MAWHRHGLRVCAWVALLGALVCARALWSARSEMAEARAALDADKTALSVTHLRRAASWHFPFNPYTSLAHETLRDLARRQREKGRMQQAQQAERAQLSAQHASRSWLRPLPSDPQGGFACLALLGWLGWCGLSWLLVSVGIDSEGTLTPRAPRLIAGVLLSFGGFLLGLACA